MTDYKFCDLHPTEDGRRTPKESIRTVVVQQWQSVRNRNRLFENKLDVCLQCLGDSIVSKAKGLKVDYESNWKTEVWQTGQSGKRFKSMMSMDELREHLEEEDKNKEIAELKARALGK